MPLEYLSDASVKTHQGLRIMSAQALVPADEIEHHDAPPAVDVRGQGKDEDGKKSKCEKALRWKVDVRLCSIAGLLCSLNLLDSGIISSASVTSMLKDLDLAQGNRYSVSILIFTVASVCCQLPATIAVRLLGPRIFLAGATFSFGLITLVGTNS